MRYPIVDTAFHSLLSKFDAEFSGCKSQVFHRNNLLAEPTQLKYPQAISSHPDMSFLRITGTIAFLNSVNYKFYMAYYMA